MSGTINATEFADKAIELFWRHQEAFGLCDADFPEDCPQASQCEFDYSFRRLICEYAGHDIGPDHCGKPEHDYCYRCLRGRVGIEASEGATK